MVGHWQALPGTQLEANSGTPERELKQCDCGCNTYQGTSPIGPTDADSLGIPVLPLTLEYEDDDAPSDDHEYVSVHVADYAQMVNQLRECTCAESST